MTHNQHLIDLLTAHLRDTLSASQEEELQQWLQASPRNRRLFQSVDDEEQLRQLVLLYHQEEEDNNEAIILQKIRQGMAPATTMAPVRKLSGWQWGWAAAIVVVVAGAGSYWLFNRKGAGKELAAKPAAITPGRDGAILTLADGRQVVLDSLGNGVIASERGTAVVLKNGSLSYSNDGGQGQAVYNQLTTPRGRQFRLVLPDGTKVWLNATSSLRYPTVFAGNQRRVQVSGEVYFEVAPDPHQPFHIDINEKAQIQVLGTQFNINAYNNEDSIRATLVDGAIRISAGTEGGDRSFVNMKPGQQAQINTTGNPGQQTVKLLNNVNVDKAVAWKNGLFNFEGASLEEVMKQVERWYDIDVVYEKGIPKIWFDGKMRNDMSLEGLLKSLKESEVHFRLEGRELIVLP